MISAASTGDEAAFSTAPAQIEAAAAGGHPGTQSALAFLTGAGSMTCPVSRSRAFLLHKFAADVGDLRSKMALAYSYFRQEKRWWKSECWTDCYTVILCTTVWIFWKGLGHGLLYEITEGHASIKNQKIPEMRWHFICELNLICSFYSQTWQVLGCRRRSLSLKEIHLSSNWTSIRKLPSLTPLWL